MKRSINKLEIKKIKKKKFNIIIYSLRLLFLLFDYLFYIFIK